MNVDAELRLLVAKSMQNPVPKLGRVKALLDHSAWTTPAHDMLGLTLPRLDHHRQAHRRLSYLGKEAEDCLENGPQPMMLPTVVETRAFWLVAPDQRWAGCEASRLLAREVC